MTKRAVPLKPTVAVGYLHRGDVSATFCISLVKMELHETFRTGMPPLILSERCASGKIVEGRNEVAVAFLDRSPADWLLFVDSDMGFAPDTLERLLKVADKQDRPIVGGLCFGLKRESTDPDHHGERFRCFPTVYVYAERDNEVGFQVVANYPREQVVPVAATGAALVLIHRRVLEAVRAKYGDNWFSQITHPKGKNGPTKFSEDMSFFIRAQACEFPVHVDTSIKTCHDKGGIFLDEQAWDRQQATVALEAQAA